MMAKLAYIKVAKILRTQIYTYMTRNVKTNHVSANYATYVNYIMVNIFSSEYSISVNLEKSAHWILHYCLFAQVSMGNK